MGEGRGRGKEGTHSGLGRELEEEEGIDRILTNSVHM